MNTENNQPYEDVREQAINILSEGNLEEIQSLNQVLYERVKRNCQDGVTQENINFFKRTIHLAPMQLLEKLSADDIPHLTAIAQRELARKQKEGTR